MQDLQFSILEGRRETNLSHTQYIDYIAEFKRNSIRNPFMNRLSQNQLEQSQKFISLSAQKQHSSNLKLEVQPQMTQFKASGPNKELEYLSDLQLDDLNIPARSMQKNYSLIIKNDTPAAVSSKSVNDAFVYEVEYADESRLQLEVTDHECQNTQEHKKLAAKHRQSTKRVQSQLTSSVATIGGRDTAAARKYEDDGREWCQRLSSRKEARAKDTKLLTIDPKTKNQLIKQYGDRIRQQNLARRSRQAQ